MEPQQLDLFSPPPPTPALKQEQLVMDADALLKWKSQITAYQQRVRESLAPQQTALFNLTPVHCDPERIDPFTLKLVPMSFYRMPADSPGESCLYFVRDTTAEIVLYIGETCRSNKRWKGVHDCKRYVEKYLELHYRYKMTATVNMSFWWDAPIKTRPRQQLELALIQKWRSPFNKEMWEKYGQPFG
ncbi:MULTISPECIES: GIY-YIG nuclease family protein [Nostocales]|uniref:GIY-YIG nuclease family protein n=1 Tax=Tolypothrix campylonemoides VB511288_2 TaxID=3232311 RepID=A0ABW8XMZ2_9CYAN